MPSCTRTLRVTADPPELVASTVAMASPVTLRVPSATPTAGALPAAINDTLALFAELEAACTRFDPDSPLMRANARPDDWHEVPALCFEALSEAYLAHLRTGGAFDPRVLGDLVRLGYGDSLPFAAGEVHTAAAPVPAPRRAVPWQPAFDPARSRVRLGGTPVDLGGIGKGLAVRMARDRLARATGDFLVDAGGDCYCAGRAADGAAWRVGVEDPAAETGLVAVLTLTDIGCATSSIRLRRWTAGERPVHHIIDPRTGEPGGAGLLSVTVLDPDPAAAEVDAKLLFLAGRAGIAAVAARRDSAALWVDEDGAVAVSPRMEERVLWRRP